MSYWRCDNTGQIFSSDQVRRMEWVLKNIRPQLISRVVTIKTVCKLILQKEYYKWIKDYTTITHPKPEPDWLVIAEKLRLDKVRDRQSINELKFVLQTFGYYRPWNNEELMTYMKKLEDAGKFRKLLPATNASVHMCTERKKSRIR